MQKEECATKKWHELLFQRMGRGKHYYTNCLKTRFPVSERFGPQSKYPGICFWCKSIRQFFLFVILCKQYETR